MGDFFVGIIQKITKSTSRYYPSDLSRLYIFVRYFKRYNARNQSKQVKSMNQKYQRSDTYRTEFIRNWPPRAGKYRCVYCGRKISKNDMEVDHVVPVKAVSHNLLYRLMVPPEGVNSLSNLVPACHKCNRRKGSKCGFWLIRGKFWRICFPLYTILRIALVVAIIGCLYFVFFGYDSEFLKTLISLFV